MKKLLLLSSLFILTSTFLNAQNLALTFDDAKITNDGTNNYYEVDVMIMRTSTSNFKLGTGQFYVDYNPAAFGTSIGDATVDFEYTAGSILAETNVLSIYGDPIINSNTNGTVSIAWQQALSAGSIAADNVTDTPAVLGHLKIQMINLDALVDICFNVIGAAFDDQFYTACGPFTPGLSIVDCTGSNAGTQILNYDGSDCLGAVPIIANAPNPLEACDEFPNDGLAEFDLTIRESQILGDQTGLTVTYHETPSDAETGVNAIANPTSYVNLTNPQNLYPRLSDPSNNYFDTTLLTLTVLPVPTPIPPTPLEACDDDNDGFAAFDLSQKDAEIIGGNTGVNITYHVNIENASAGNNPLPSIYINEVPDVQTIYARLENVTTGCFGIVDLTLLIDTTIPTITCPTDQSILLDSGELYEVPDYWENGEATATDNCTDPIIILTQNPVPGTLLGIGLEIVTLTAEDENGNVSTCSFELTIEEVLGTNDDQYFKSIMLFPNPANNKVYLSNPSQLDLNNVSIHDLSGRIIKKIDLTAMESEITIDVSDFANATYFIVINASQGTTTKQLIVNN